MTPLVSRERHGRLALRPIGEHVAEAAFAGDAYHRAPSLIDDDQSTALQHAIRREWLRLTGAFIIRQDHHDQAGGWSLAR